MQFRGEKYLNTFIVTNANDCPNLLSHGTTFKMGVLLPNYLEENVVKGENVPNFKISTSTGSSNVFQILQDLQLKQYQETSSNQTRTSQTSTTDTTCTTTQPIPLTTYGYAPANQNTGMATPLLVCLSRRLHPGPQCLLRPHPVQDNQPLKYIEICHVTDFHNVVCMYTNQQVRFVSRENH